MGSGIAGNLECEGHVGRWCNVLASASGVCECCGGTAHYPPMHPFQHNWIISNPWPLPVPYLGTFPWLTAATCSNNRTILLRSPEYWTRIHIISVVFYNQTSSSLVFSWIKFLNVRYSDPHCIYVWPQLTNTTHGTSYLYLHNLYIFCLPHVILLLYSKESFVKTKITKSFFFVNVKSTLVLCCKADPIFSLVGNGP